LFVYEYIKKIFEGLSYQYNAPFFEQAFFKTLIIPHNQKLITGTKTNIFKGGKTPTTSLTIPGLSTAFSSIKMQFKSTTVTTSDNILFTYNGTSSRFKLHFVETYAIVGSGLALTSAQLRINAYRRVSGVDTLVAQSVFYDYVGSGLYPFDFTAEFDLSTSQQFFFALEVVSGQFQSRTILYKSQYNQLSISIDSLTPLIQPLVLNDTITMNDTIPKNIMQKDFLSSIMKMFNLYLYEDSTLQKMIKIKPYVDFYDTDVIMHLIGRIRWTWANHWY